MKTYLILFLLSVCLGCATGNNETIEALVPSTFSQPNPIYGPKNERTQPYDISFSIAEADNNEFTFILNMNPDSGAYYISPFSKGPFKGKFTMGFPTDKPLETVGPFLEIPRATEQVNPWGNGPVSFVKNNTVYKQNFKINSAEDFEAFGMVTFVIEPQCTKETIGFKISQKDGRLTVTQKTGGC